MAGLKLCRICLDSYVQMHQISGSEVQNVYEKLVNIQVQDGQPHFACYLCYRQLQNCLQLILRAQRSAELFTQFAPVNKENMNLWRVSKGLIHPFMAAKIQTLEIFEQIVDVKVEKQDENYDDTTFEFDNGLHPSIKLRMDIKQEFEQEEGISTEIKQEDISDTEIMTFINENELFGTACENKNKQLSVKSYKEYFICNDCGKSCDTKDILIKHIHAHKPVIRKQAKMLVTQTCNDKLTTNAGIKKKKSFKCRYCNRSYSRKSKLNIHMRTHNEEKPYKCPYCSHACKKMETLKIHIRIHTGEKPYKCLYCSCAFTQNGHLKVHIRRHTGEKPYECPHCSYTSKKMDTLKTHIRTHTGEKPYKCSYCSCTFTQNIHLVNHIRTHTGERPYKCTFCDYACKQGGDLKKHMRIHTDQKPFKCQHCSYTCTESDKLKKHIIRIHTAPKPYK